MSWLMAMPRRWWIILWVGEEPEPRPLPRARTGNRNPRRDVLGGPLKGPLADRSLGLCDACGVAWGVEIWLHPDQLLVTVLCRHHSTDQSVALLRHDWSRLVQPSPDVQLTTAAGRTTRG